MDLRVSGTCAPHPRNGRIPRTLLRTAEVRVSLPPELELDPTSLTPPGLIRDGVLTWELSDVGTDGIDLSYRIVPTAAGRHRGFVTATVDYLDGWLNAGTAVFDAPHVIARPASGPTARLFLPAATK
jgi:hypothetical protein